MAALRSQLDHLVVAAATLEAGIAHVKASLGVEVPFGGKHPLMGTHNCLMLLGETCFLEIISIDPQASSLGRPRWFGLDDPAIQERISEQPCLLTWACRTTNLAAAVDASSIDTGPIEEGRRGDLVWHITIPADGSLPEGGLFPTLLQWPESLGPHGPAPRMADLGCQLERLELTAPDPKTIETGLTAVGFDGPVKIVPGKTQNLTAHIATNDGPRALS